MNKFATWAAIIASITAIGLGGAWKMHAASRSVPAALMLSYMDWSQAPRFSLLPP